MGMWTGEPVNGMGGKMKDRNDNRGTERGETSQVQGANRTLSRRKALARLGLAAGIAYTAPTIVRLDRSANAKALPTPCPPPGSKGGPPWCR